MITSIEDVGIPASLPPFDMFSSRYHPPVSASTAVSAPWGAAAAPREGVVAEVEASAAAK